MKTIAHQKKSLKANKNSILLDITFLPAHVGES